MKAALPPRLRPAVAAAAAMLLGGDAASLGLRALLEPGRYVFPYLALFLAVAFLESRRKVRDAEVFLLGAAFGLLRDGALLKLLQHGEHPLGIAWAGTAVAVFDWGMIAALARRAASLVPGPAHARPGVPEAAALGAAGVLALGSYVVDTWSGRWILARELGSTWLLADILFCAGAVWLAGRALRRRAGEDRWLRPLAAAAAWAAPARWLAGFAGWPSPAALALVAAWTGAVAWAAARAPRAPRWVPHAAAAWRAAGAVALPLALGPGITSPLAPAAFALFVESPSRLLAAWHLLRAPEDE